MFRRLREYRKFLVSLAKTNWRLIIGMWRLTRLPHPAITIFGGARVDLESEVAKQAKALAHKLVEQGFSIITGGGPGIMEAANYGAIEFLRECDLNSPLCRQGLVSAGIGLIRLNKERVNPYVQQSITMNHFFARKWLLVRYAIGFIVFPGGFGTLDELAEVITLIQCNRMPRLPVILIGVAYWQPLKEWIYESAVKSGMLTDQEAAIIVITDDIDEAVKIIQTKCLTCKESIIADDSNPK